MGGSTRLSGHWPVSWIMTYQVEVIDLAKLPPGNKVLTQQEQVYYDTLRVPKRRTEWLGGRFALKRLLSKTEQVDVKQVEILPTVDGKPMVTVGGKTYAGAFSITHSHGFAVAALDTQADYIGIDLEKVEHRIDAWKTGFFHPDELTGSGDEFLTALWTQKEAVVKLLGTGLSINSFDVRCVQGKVQFYGAALEVYHQLGCPQISLSTTSLLPGFMFSVAQGQFS